MQVVKDAWHWFAEGMSYPSGEEPAAGHLIAQAQHSNDSKFSTSKLGIPSLKVMSSNTYRFGCIPWGKHTLFITPWGYHVSSTTGPAWFSALQAQDDYLIPLKSLQWVKTGNTGRNNTLLLAFTVFAVVFALLTGDDTWFALIGVGVLMWLLSNKHIISLCVSPAGDTVLIECGRQLFGDVDEMLSTTLRAALPARVDQTQPRSLFAQPKYAIEGRGLEPNWDAALTLCDAAAYLRVDLAGCCKSCCNGGCCKKCIGGPAVRFGALLHAVQSVTVSRPGLWKVLMWHSAVTMLAMLAIAVTVKIQKQSPEFAEEQADQLAQRVINYLLSVIGAQLLMLLVQMLCRRSQVDLSVPAGGIGQAWNAGSVLSAVQGAASDHYTVFSVNGRGLSNTINRDKMSLMGTMIAKAAQQHKLRPMLVLSELALARLQQKPGTAIPTSGLAKSANCSMNPMASPDGVSPQSTMEALELEASVSSKV